MKINFFVPLLMACVMVSCNSPKPVQPETNTETDGFNYVIDRFDDVEIMRYTLDNWDELSLQQKTLIYYLSQAALCGRDIIFDQNCKYNLTVKSVIGNIMQSYNGSKEGEDWTNFVKYVKRFWFSNGMHHHYSNEKFIPECSQDYFCTLLGNSEQQKFSLLANESFTDFTARIINIIYNPSIAPTRIFHSDNPNADLVINSAINFYEGVTQSEVEQFYAKMGKKDDVRPVSYGLNSKVVKNEKGKLQELPYKIGGFYSEAIKQIVFWLEKAVTVAENPVQKKHVELLIAYYRTGDLAVWDEYNVEWVKDIDSHVDYVNGFIEVYTDPLGRKATWEALVNYKDQKNSERTTIISKNAQWFEDNSPIAPEFKKKEVKGIEAKVIIAAHLGGDCYPSTPIGINLPNANWIRKEHGSKSVTINNVMYAYSQARMQSGCADEFFNSRYEIDLQERYGFVTENLLVDLHECLGHGSGQMLQGVDDGALKNYHSVIEETRADLFALYFIADPKVVELGLLPNDEAYYAAYYNCIMNGMMLNLNRIALGDQIMQPHMRNRSLIAKWCYEAGMKDNVIEMIKRDHKTYLKINDYEKLRELMGELLQEVQRIKSTGDFSAARELVEAYGVKVDPDLHKEVKDRYALLNVASYGGFVNPIYDVIQENGKIVDVKVHYVEDYVQQMLDYDRKFNFLK